MSRTLLCLLPLLVVPARAQEKPKVNTQEAPAPVWPHHTPKPHPAIPSLEVPGALGVNIHFTDAREGELEMLEAGGFRVARMDFAWSGTERVKGEYDFSAYDRLIKGLEAHHIQPLFILDYANPLYDEGLAPHTDAGRAAFAKWAASAAAHFKGHRVLWEMYNEPNGDGFWKPKENVNDYIQLALTTGRAIRASAPGECYIGPAVSGMDLRYLEACFQAGLLELWDAVSVHPYRQSDPETVVGDYQRLRLLIERYKPQGKTIPILSGEWGYSSAWNDFNDERQGKYLPRQWMTNLMNGVPVSIWYDWHDDGSDPKEGEHHFGTTNNAYLAGRTPVYDPKPSYIAARTFAQFFKGFRFNKRLALASPDDYLLLFSRGNEVKVAVWTTGAAHDVVIPASKGALKIVTYLGGTLPQETAVAGSGLKLRISETPLYMEAVAPNELWSKAALWATLPLDYGVKAPAEVYRSLSFMRVAPPLTEMVDAVRVYRDSKPVNLTASCSIEGVILKQASQAVITNPLSLVAEPAPDRKLLVRVENPMGIATKGEVALNDQKPQTIDFADKETQKESSFPAPATDAAGGWSAKVRFTGPTPDDFVETNVRFVPLSGFGALAAGNLATSLVARADGSPEVKSEQTLSVVANAPEAAPADGPILKLAYRFSPGWKFANVQPLGVALSRIEGTPKKLGMWVYGDGTGNLLRMRWSDATGQTFQPNGVAIPWKGWRYVSLPIETTSARWGGANDGTIHGDIKVETLFLLDAAQQNGTQGEIYVCTPSWIY